LHVCKVLCILAEKNVFYPLNLGAKSYFERINMANKQKQTSRENLIEKERKSRVAQADVPRHTLYEAVRVPKAICDNFAKAPTKPFNVAAALDLKPNSSHFRMLIGASSAYGLTEGSYGSDFIVLTDLGRQIVAPTEEGIDIKAMKDAMLKPRVINEFLKKYNNSKVPVERIAQNVLEEMGVPLDSSKQTFQMIIKSAKDMGFLRELKGDLYVDLDIKTATKITAEISKEPNTSSLETNVKENNMNSSDETEDSNSNVGSNSLPLSTTNNNQVFITHGRNKDIVNQLKELLSFGKFTPIVAEENETVSKPVPEKVLDSMRSCYAAIIHVGKEIKVLDQEGKEHIFLNQNVLIEIGAAMALYGGRFILLVEQGTSLPSNLQGLYQVRYEGTRLDYDATMKLLRAFNDFRS
jgi:predicted nucleotide-binding protein